MILVLEQDKVPSSFRDPSGFLFEKDGEIYRQVNTVYQQHYDHLMDSGLYDTLVNSYLLIAHSEEQQIDKTNANNGVYKIIKPEVVPFISYPYEWTFSQLKDAALATLQIQKTALEFGMTLKDSTAYNIQFMDGKPVLIDTLSFEKYEEGLPWKAYKQFCQHFLVPLALMSYTDIRLNQLLKSYIDGIPLDLASKLLPFRSRLNFSLLTHIYLHAATQKRYEDKPVNTSSRRLSKTGLLAIIDSLESSVKKMKWKAEGTEWADYYENTNYTDEALEFKKQFVSKYIEQIKPTSVWDLGANTGIFSRLAAKKNIPTISFDIDPAAVEKNYLHVSNTQENNILPLILDLTNPSPGIGWENAERMSLVERGPADVVLALALIHHLAISNNIPLARIARFLSRISRHLIIEFVPKEDSQVQRLLATREDIFMEYNKQKCEEEFRQYFIILESQKVIESHRTLYLMKVKT